MDSVQSLLPYLVPAVIAAGSAYFFMNKKSKLTASFYRINRNNWSFFFFFYLYLFLGEVLDAKVFKNFKLAEKIVISHNTAM